MHLSGSQLVIWFFIFAFENIISIAWGHLLLKWGMFKECIDFLSAFIEQIQTVLFSTVIVIPKCQHCRMQIVTYGA